MERHGREQKYAKKVSCGYYQIHLNGVVLLFQSPLPYFLEKNMFITMPVQTAQEMHKEQLLWMEI